MTAAFDRGWRKAVRTIAQLAAGGALTAVVTAMAGGLNPQVQALVMGAWTALIAFVQNWLETAGTIPTLLPTRTPVAAAGAVAGLAVATVGAVVQEGGQVVGDVIDTTGHVVGKVTGQVDPPSD